MNIQLIFAFLFFVGSMLGWILEFFFRNLVSHKGPRIKGLKYINPGFCRGPYLPIYGVGLCVMFFISYSIKEAFPDCSDLVLILGIAVAMTVIEFVGGLFLLKVLNMRLWDYREQPFNIMGLICPVFSVIWGLIGVVYYLFIHPLAIDGLVWLSQNLAFSFFVGLFFGFFIIDIALSTQDAMIIKEYGDNNDVIIKYEELKESVLIKMWEQEQSKGRFFNQTRIRHHDLRETLDELEEFYENKKKKIKK